VPLDVRPGDLAHERRSGSAQFGEFLESIARQSVERGNAVSLIWLSVACDVAQAPAADSRGVQSPPAPALIARRWVREIRTHLRPADLVGLLTDREIAVLLQDAPDHHAKIVARRLRDLFMNDENATAAPHALLGFASWAPGDPSPGALVQQARQRAVQPDVT
jgi:hypothetical protein